MVSQVLAILLVDIKGYTPRAASSSRQEVLQLLDKFRSLTTQVVKRFGGEVIKEIGDAFLVVFESPTNAVAAGALLQQMFKDRNRSVTEADRIEVRVAIHSGEVELVSGDIFGDAVNTAARVEDVTEAGEVYFTEAVFLTMNRSEVPSCEVGERVLRGLAAPVRLYRLLQDPADERYQKLLIVEPGARLSPRARRRRTLLGFAAAILLIAAAAAAVVLLLQKDPAMARARALARAGHQAEAVDLLLQAFEKAPPGPEELRLLQMYAGGAVHERMYVRDYSAARELAARWAGRYPFLRTLTEEVAIEEARQLNSAGRPAEAVTALRAAIAAGHDTWGTRLALARTYARDDFPVEGRRLGIYMEAADEIDAAVSRCPKSEPLPAEVEVFLWKQFSVQPRGRGEALDSRGRRLCQLVREHLWPKYRGQLIQGCASEEEALRLSSYEVLAAADALKEADLVAYHGHNLAQRVSRKKQEEALAYFEALTDPIQRSRAYQALKEAAAKLDARSDSDAREMLPKVNAALKRMEAGGPPAPAPGTN